MGGSVLRGISSIVFVAAIIVGMSSANGDTFQPVSQTAHVSAHADGSPTVIDNPPDQTAGAVFTTISNSAHAFSPTSSLDGTASATSTLSADKLVMRGACSGGKLTGGAQAFGSGLAQAKVSFPTDVKLLIASGRSNIYAVGGVGITDSANNSIYNGAADINEYIFGEPTFAPLNLPAGTYTFSLSFSGGVAVGTGGNGAIGFTVIPVPEPGATLFIVLSGISLIRRRN